MVTTTEHTHLTPGTLAAQPRLETPSNLRWGAIFGGAFATLGIGVMLYSLGLALGLTSLDPADPSSLRPSAMFTGIWALVVSLVALFIGGFVAARGVRAATHTAGVLHGLVMWGLTVTATLWLAVNIASAAISGAASIGRTATQALMGAAPAPGQLAQAAQSLGITSQDVLVPINRRLEAQGQPQITAAQLEAATRDVVQQAVRQGQLDEALLVDAIATNTQLSRQDAQQVANRMVARFETAKNQLDQTLASAGTTALRVAEDTGTAFWGIFGSLFLGMLSAMGGAYVGANKGSRRRTEPASVEPREQPRGPHEEAYTT